MRLVCELILILGLIALGWQKSFKQWSDEWRGLQHAREVPVRQTTKVNAAPATTPAPPRQPFISTHYVRTVPARPQPTISNGDWMWDPAHHSSLDRPAYDSKTLPTYQDTTGRRYWIDGHGIRHYDSGTPPPSGY